jgi:hypothetical protein
MVTDVSEAIEGLSRSLLNFEGCDETESRAGEMWAPEQ